MTNYNFSSLSSFDFELLVRDLLQKELNGITLESFKSGRDGGIDLRYSKYKRNEIVIQCKHFVNSKYSDLIVAIKKEVPKLKMINPKRYILATSLGLTPANKTEISNLIGPYILNTGDIIGTTDLNNLLGKFPEIEKKHFKLWLSSEAVMSRILHNDVYNASEIGIENMKEKIKFYVQNKSFSRAKKVLEEHNYCIISGAPGIGKTTLAEILIFHYMASGFEAFKISNISDALKIFNHAKKQFFYFDDFLGQTNLERKLNMNEDDILINFLKRIQKTSNTKFILTTREYILNQAKITYEKLSSPEFDHTKCIINLADYTMFNKAEILYNHLYFSKIPQKNKESILENKNYMKIINHPNYSPRIIEWMTLVNNKEDPKYFNSFIENLNNPFRLWEHAFEYQISDVAQTILKLMSTLTDQVLYDDLITALESYDRVNSVQSNVSELKKALKQLEGTFIKINKQKNETIILFSNPSIRDFIENYLSGNLSELRKLCNSLHFFDQHISLWNNKKCNKLIIRNLSSQFIASVIDKFNNANYKILNTGTGYSPRKETICYEERFIFILNTIRELKMPIPREDLKKVERQLLDRISHGEGKNSRVPLLLNALQDIGFSIGISKQDWIQVIKTNMYNTLDEFDTFEILSQIEIDIFSRDEKEYLREKFNEIFESEQNYYLNQENERDNVESFASALEDVSIFLDIEVQKSLDLLGRRVKKLEEEISDMDYSDFEYDSWKESRFDRDDNSNIDSLFDSLMR